MLALENRSVGLLVSGSGRHPFLEQKLMPQPLPHLASKIRWASFAVGSASLPLPRSSAIGATPCNRKAVRSDSASTAVEGVVSEVT